MVPSCMGWLLTIVLGLPLTNSDVEINMWFSKESYCIFAVEKFTEKPFTHKVPDGTVATGEAKSASCRELTNEEAAIVPEHLRWKTKPFGGLFSGN
jgi:hypothetical protein